MKARKACAGTFQVLEGRESHVPDWEVTRVAAGKKRGIATERCECRGQEAL